MMVLIMRGIPGSGKSTEARRWAALVTGTLIFSMDDYMYAGGRAFNAMLIERCHEQCRADFELALQAKTPLVIVDNTNTKFSSMVPYVELIEKYRYAFTVLQFHVKPEIAAERNTHGVPLETLEKMGKHMWFERVPTTWNAFSKGKPWRPTDLKNEQG